MGISAETNQAVYKPRSENLIQKILKNHFHDFESVYESIYSGTFGKFSLDRISGSVERFLDCGDYTKGIARISCTDDKCDHEYFRPFSCKQWYLCPSCHQKRLLLFSEHLCEETLFKLPHRQFVFTVPKILRPYFRHDKKLYSEISKFISELICEYYRLLSGKDLTTGLVVSFQSYGDMLRFHPHWHCIVLEGGIDDDFRFHHSPLGDTKELCEAFRQKVVRFFSTKGLLNEKMASSLLSWVHSGFSVDHSVRLLSGNRKAMGKLSQYIARHPFSLKKIHYIKEKAQVLYLTKYTPGVKENVKLFPVLDFIAELTQHIPPKGKHLIRYYGLYSSRTTGKVAKSGRLDKFRVAVPSVIEPEIVACDKKKKNKAWARLIQKVYETDPMICPQCGSEMKIVAVITDPASIMNILDHLKSKGLPPYESPKSHSPPVRELLITQA